MSKNVSILHGSVGVIPVVFALFLLINFGRNETSSLT
jgi:hypothetical protein